MRSGSPGALLRRAPQLSPLDALPEPQNLGRLKVITGRWGMVPLIDVVGAENSSEPLAAGRSMAFVDQAAHAPCANAPRDDDGSSVSLVASA